jgi:hypothetical protein
MKSAMPTDQPALSEAATASIEDIGAGLKPGEDKEITMYVCKDDAGAVTVKDETEYQGGESETTAEDATAGEEMEPTAMKSKRPKAVEMALAGM